MDYDVNMIFEILCPSTSSKNLYKNFLSVSKLHFINVYSKYYKKEEWNNVYFSQYKMCQK
jgi:hypothetical protein